MSRMAIIPVVGLMAALVACGPVPEEEVDAAPVAQVAPDPENTRPVTEGAGAAPSAAVAEEPRRRRRGPEGGEQTLRGLEQRMLAGFDRLDIDGDDRLTPDELAAGDGPGGARMLRRADTDGNGTLTRDEVRQAAGALFEMMDVDGNGVVTEAERPRRDR
ncbi:EF-hand domain-containing protein [Brevundimonas sp.]|uniref:EF-hand domain-containing protein n=1 Tax=Brevundimonas sp. TaxID=1871086 RepID=UPI003AF98F07